MQGSANLNLMIKAARKAGRSLVKDFREVENLQVSSKGPGDFVSKADREAMRLSLELAGGTEPIVMFPEGTRRSGPVLRAEDMHDGPAYVACKAGIPIVPVGIGGSEDAMPKGAKGIRPVKLAIDIGTPIHPPKSTTGRVSRRAVRDLTEELRAEIQVLFDRSQERVGKPNPPP